MLEVRGNMGHWLVLPFFTRVTVMNEIIGTNSKKVRWKMAWIKESKFKKNI